MLNQSRTYNERYAISVSLSGYLLICLATGLSSHDANQIGLLFANNTLTFGFY